MQEMSLMVVTVSLSNKEVMELSVLGETQPDLKLDTARDYLSRPSPGLLARCFNSLHLLRVSGEVFLFVFCRLLNFFMTHRTLWDDKKLLPSRRISHWWTASTPSFLDALHTGVRHVRKKSTVEMLTLQGIQLLLIFS